MPAPAAFVDAIIVAVEDPMPIAPGVTIPLAEIELRTSRSSGPGGQHANVTASRVEAMLDLSRSTALGDEHKKRIVKRLGARPRAVAQDARGQARNRELALLRLQTRLSNALREAPARRPTRPSRAERERRLADKRRKATRKAARQRPLEDET